MSLVSSFKKAIILCLACIGFSSLAHAQPELIEQNRDWAVFKGVDGDNPVCFIISQPKSYDPMPVSRHGDVFFYVSNRPKDDVKEEPSLKVGYEFRQNSKVRLAIGDANYDFMTTGEYAFPDDGVSMSAIIASMRAGSDMKITATSARGTNVSYTFSLSGVTAGLNKITSECDS